MRLCRFNDNRLGVVEGDRVVRPGTVRLRLDQNLIVLSLLTGGKEKAACFYYPPSSRYHSWCRSEKGPRRTPSLGCDNH